MLNTKIHFTLILSGLVFLLGACTSNKSPEEDSIIKSGIYVSHNASGCIESSEIIYAVDSLELIRNGTFNSSTTWPQECNHYINPKLFTGTWKIQSDSLCRAMSTEPDYFRCSRIVNYNDFSIGLERLFIEDQLDTILYTKG